MAAPRIKPPAPPQPSPMTLACHKAIEALYALDAGARIDYHYPLVRIFQEFLIDLAAAEVEE